MEAFEEKALDNYGSLVINKSFGRKAGFGSRAIPVYVREWIVAHYVADSLGLTDEARSHIAEFVRKYVPDKGDREAVKNQLFEQNEVRLLDDYSVQVNLAKGDRYLIVPFLDESKAYVSPNIVSENQMLLSSGLWGVGSLSYAPPTEEGPGQVMMRSFTPFQLASLNLDYFVSRRRDFTAQEWIDFIVSSMGFNHQVYSQRQKILLIYRLLPMVEPRYNLIELAPKGTGKSFVYENMSRYVAVRSGSVTAPVLFYNDARKTPGLITRFDCVVIDEAQKVKGDRSGELTALLKSYLEAGRFARGSAGSTTAECGLVILANIDLDEHKRPLHESIGLFRNFPNFLRETAFLDRFSGLLPGWDLPRVTKDTPSSSLGLKGDIFGEILHMLRSDISYRDFVKTNMELDQGDDMRDSRAIEAGATAMLKILFPHKEPTEAEFYEFCVNPALEMRQRVRDELSKLDREYAPISMRSKYPDLFQTTHRKAAYVDPDRVDLTKLVLQVESEVSEESALLVPGEGSELEERTLRITEGDTGYSYRNLFGPYLKGTASLVLTDPYIRLEYQIRNLLAFIDIIDTVDGPVSFQLITGADDEYQRQINDQKFSEIANGLVEHGISFTHEFSSTIHRRGIELDNGWRIVIDRGLDLYQRPDSKYDLGYTDQTKRKCRETEIVFIKK